MINYANKVSFQPAIVNIMPMKIQKRRGNSINKLSNTLNGFKAYSSSCSNYFKDNHPDFLRNKRKKHSRG
jgi:hypothetical protein